MIISILLYILLTGMVIFLVGGLMLILYVSTKEAIK